MRIFRLKKKAQDFQGYYAGDVPDYAADILGTSMVDASQIKSMFGKVDEAINLVNRYDSSLLQNVSFIFNFSKGGAYGVFLPALDRAIKNKALQKELERMGYEVDIDENGMVTARHTREQKTPEQIQQDIDSIKQNIESKGGTAFGINMNDVLNASRMDAQESQSEDPNIWEWMALLHLGATIVHEAIHAKGNEGEGPSEAGEANFMNWALPIINEEYKNQLEGMGQGEMYAPLQLSGTKRQAEGRGWYKKAQMTHYFPQSYFEAPSGSDLAGRFPVGIQTDQGMAGWAMLMQEDQSVPIEKRLGRQFMSPIPPDLNQEHDIYDEQLRKSREGGWKLDPDATMEELLSESHDKNRAFYTLEELLEEKRPKPLMVPLERTASNKMTKIATLFGWFNNLEISDGSTIPGLSDRVMAWEDADEDFKWTEEEIRSQPRYNPTYDIKGFYYRYIEPRFHPQLWTDMMEDVTNTAPAKRFAATDTMKENKEMLRILSVLSSIRNKIRRGDIKSTRLVMTEDVTHIVNNLFRATAFKVVYYPLDKTPEGEVVYSVWIGVAGVPDAQIQQAEEFFRGVNKNDELVENLIGYSSQKRSVVDEVIKAVKDICKEYGIEDVYLVGGYPRDLVLKGNDASVEDLDFSGAWPNQSLKVGGLLAERLGVADVEFFHRTMTLSFEYKGLKIDFRGNFSPTEIRSQLRKLSIPTTPFNLDIYNRDFTFNMMVYNVMDGKIYDVTGRSVDDLKRGVIRTFLNPHFVCRENPLVILRALKFQLRYGFKIDTELQKAMITYADKLFDGKFSDSRLRIGRLNVEREDKAGAQRLFKEYGLEKIMEV